MTNWNVLRAAGIGSYIMLFLAVAWGLAGTTTPFGKRISKPSATLVHQFMSTCGLFLLAIHMGALLVDRFMPFGVADLFIPLSSTYRPIGVLLGVVAMYLTVIIIVTSWLRKPMGTKWWRRFHVLAIPTFILTMLHGIFSGTDNTRPAMWWTYVATGSIVVFLVTVRALTVGLRPERKAPPAHARVVPERAAVEA
jgi:DMSO/TMAO reductase YedYZ heme-binding membrane subunit